LNLGFVFGPPIALTMSSTCSQRRIRGANGFKTHSTRRGSTPARSVATLWRFEARGSSAGRRCSPRQPAWPWREKERLPGRLTCRVKRCRPIATFSDRSRNLPMRRAPDFAEQPHPRSKLLVARRFKPIQSSQGCAAITWSNGNSPSCSNGSGHATWGCEWRLKRSNCVPIFTRRSVNSDGSHNPTMRG